MMFGTGTKEKTIDSFQFRSDIDGELLLKDGKIKYYEIYIDNFKKLYYNNNVKEMEKYKLLTFLDLSENELNDYSEKYGDETIIRVANITKEKLEQIKKTSQE